MGCSRAFNGGLDIEMTSTSFYYHFEDLLNKKLVSLSDLNTKVARVLRLKFRMNLF
jgi:beta-glucosidase-like glycosyl hydrolase